MPLVPSVAPLALCLVDGSILDERTLFPAGVVVAIVVTLFFGYRFLTDQFDGMKKARADDKTSLDASLEKVCSRLEAVERNQRTRWSLEHMAIFALRLERDNRDLKVTDPYEIARLAPPEDPPNGG